VRKVAFFDLETLAGALDLLLVVIGDIVCVLNGGINHGRRRDPDGRAEYERSEVLRAMTQPVEKSRPRARTRADTGSDARNYATLHCEMKPLVVSEGPDARMPGAAVASAPWLA
jgi:hypothetical protein